MFPGLFPPVSLGLAQYQDRLAVWTAAYCVGMSFGAPFSSVTVQKDGRQWRGGTDADVDWIQQSTTIGATITSAIPPVFAAFATIVIPNQDQGRSVHVSSMLRLLRDQSPDQAWWLGYLDTGSDDVVFPKAPRVTLYTGWQYVLVQAGPDQATTWRQDLQSWRAPGPDLMFPTDRSWLLSWLWDDDWRCFGGPTAVVDRMLVEPQLEARHVRHDEDATPPGHITR